MRNTDIPRQTSKKEPHTIEQTFEKGLWSIRYIVLLGVLFGALSAIVLFVAGSLEIYSTLVDFIFKSNAHVGHEEILIAIIGAIDFYLIALVLLIFTFGIYELFISKIDIAHEEGEFGNILEVKNLDDLKNKIVKVIIMVLIVSFFQRILSMEFTTSYDMLAMAISICVICVGVYFLGRHH